ncbi:MAG: hypothetical protein M3Q33_01495 [Acidobacteriota bacterium]|nr:hypothetical protein [Acidobacteriota bacterium]
MLAILYLACMIYFGDRISRYFFRFHSIQHRFATSFLVGLLLSSCITYLGSLAFAFTAQPLIMGNIIFLGIFILVAFKLPRRPSSSYLDSVNLRPVGDGKWDWLFLGILFIFACWLIFATLSYQDGNFQFGFKSWSDFGANLSLAQSLLVGHNFPTEHPFFAGEIIRYHFLFWFQSANLAFLGLNLVSSVNLLSLLSLMALLILIMTFAELLFNSRVVGRIAAILFFFALSSLSYIPFLWSQPDIGGAMGSILNSTQFLDSGYPFRGENWGALSVSVFAYQRHLISGVGIVFVVMVFLADFYRHKKSLVNPEPTPIENGGIPTEEREIVMEGDEIPAEERETAMEDDEIPMEDDEIAMEDDEIPMEDDEILMEDDEISTEVSEIPLEASEITREDGRIPLEASEITTEEGQIPTEDDEISTETDEILTEEDEISNEDDETATEHYEEIPQKNNKRGFRFSTPEDFWVDIRPLLFCGVLIGALPYWNSAVFGSVMIMLGSIFLFFPYRLYLGSLIGMAIVVGLPQVLLLKSGNVPQTGQSLFTPGYIIANPTVWLTVKYLVWTFGFKWILIFVALWFLPKPHRRLFLAVSVLIPVVFLLQLSPDAFNNHKLLNVWNMFALIYAAYTLWRIGKGSVSRTLLAVILALVMVFGAIIDLFPIHNDSNLVMPYENDRLTTWVFENTKTSDVFLTQQLLTHPILFAGRKIFFANTLFAWTAGYDVGARETIYRQMFQEHNPDELLRLLHNNNIAYIGVDNGVRTNSVFKDNLNETVIQQNFEKVFEDTEHRYDNLIIYKVPAGDFGVPPQ